MTKTVNKVNSESSKKKYLGQAIILFIVPVVGALFFLFYKGDAELRVVIEDDLNRSAPVHIKLEDAGEKKMIVNGSAIFENLSPGMYRLKIEVGNYVSKKSSKIILFGGVKRIKNINIDKDKMKEKDPEVIKGLVAHYTFKKGSMKDLSGKGNDASFAAGGKLFGFGREGFENDAAMLNGETWIDMGFKNSFDSFSFS